jgi:iron complex transport system substrate-binding protein
MCRVLENERKGLGVKFTRLLVLVFILGVVSLAGCKTALTSPSTTVATPANYADDLGRIVRVNAVSQRIVSLSPSNTEVVYALGLHDRLIGVTTFDNYPPEVQDKPKVAEFDKVDMEKIVSLKPDLVLASDIHKTDVVPALEKLGIPVVVLRPGTIEDMLSNIQLVGQITGKTPQADALINSLRARLATIEDKTAGAAGKPRVLYVTWHDPIWTAGGNTIVQDLVRRAGGVNIASDLDGYAIITLEAVIERNPEIIIVMSSMGDQNTSLNYINSEPRLQATDALKNKQVYSIDADIFGRTTPRLVDGLEQLAKMTHPELFK